ncbi:8-amino-7-oxononanoate synthase [Salinisphaera sp. LB1]|uniref:8-amino-7-oxononanoate synthase n=1 Tax=Salinisphaera sp. LB1 TaxID=2183911 RepID=UPI000D706AA0|nr:8-amino-7-oxononanoate synthase [Salinisphaera sp. LB1]AWN14623.1 8-amino-7-oxononanoate synthase [Salinisphaera sp. LB1]
MTGSLHRVCRQRLAAIDAAGRRRRRRVIDGGHGVQVCVDGRRALNFCSNDYLGLATDPRLAAALSASARVVGAGSGASQLVTGYNTEHAALEADLADWLGRERALVFSTGYGANVGVIAALLGKGDHIVADALNHASLIDGSRLSGAAKHIYAHGDAAAADAALAGARDGHRLLVTDAVFSMDGDTAPLVELAQVARARDGWLMVDDAHGIGVFGPDGAGRVAEAGLDSGAVPLLTGTLGKSIGAAGAFVAGDDDIIEAILQTARSLIFSTAMPAAVAAAARSGLSIIRAEPERRAHLHALVARFRTRAADTGLSIAASDSPIQPVIVGEERKALALSDALLARGYLVGAIRPPTVAPGTSRLRITLSAAHDLSDVDGLIDALAESWQALSGAVGVSP